MELFCYENAPCVVYLFDMSRVHMPRPPLPFFAKLFLYLHRLVEEQLLKDSNLII